MNEWWHTLLKSVVHYTSIVLLVKVRPHHSCSRRGFSSVKPTNACFYFGREAGTALFCLFTYANDDA